MILITRKENCCGCEACAQVCPKKCIRMQADGEGFLYPVVERELCVECGLCEQVCPILYPFEKRKPEQTKAVRSLNESIRLQSSSGGIFSELANWIINKGGIVYGAVFTHDWSVKHISIETIEEISLLRGSKYVQSRIDKIYEAVRSSLKDGRWVLFSGTSCQIAGLNRYLRSKSYERLFLVEVVCHGVPNEKIWKKYLNGLDCKNINKLSQVQFRNKDNGWKNYHINIKWTGNEIIQPFRENPYMQCFIKNLSLRPSCYQCRAKSFATGADIALADYWGVQTLQPALDDDKGVGLAFVFTEKAMQILSELNIISETVTDYEDLFRFNPNIHSSAARPVRRWLFFVGLKLGIPFSFLAKGLAHNGFRKLLRIG